jgi:DNA-directed RNA polymerase specialized sigma24 family protein
MCTIEESARDRFLLEQCLAGDEVAWKVLFEYYQPFLNILVKKSLGSRVRDEDMIRDICGEVWCALLSKARSRLVDFDPNKRCRLHTYLNHIARFEILHRVKAINQRMLRERIADLAPLVGRDQDGLADILLQEFLATLTLREREFCSSHLMCSTDPGEAPCLSQANVWQLRHRVMSKLKKFIELGPRKNLPKTNNLESRHCQESGSI